MRRYVQGCRFTQNGIRYIRFGRNPSIRLGTVKELPTKAHIERAARPFVDAYNDRRPVTTYTLGQVIDKYRAEVMSKRASTAATDGSWIKNHIEPKWSTTPLGEFGKPPEVIASWLKSLSLGTKSKREIKGILRRMVNAAVVWGWIPSAPEIGKITLKRQKGEIVKKARVLPLDEFYLMVAKLQEPFKTMAFVAYFHGLRISEVFGLKWANIDWLRKQMTILVSVVNQIEDDTKTPRSNATLPLDDAELEMLKACRQKSDFTEPNNYIFASPFQAGELPYSYTGVKQIFWRACDDAKITRITPHSFRHSLRAWLKSKGISAELTTEMMRHTKFDQSREYGNDGTISPEVRKLHSQLVQEALKYHEVSHG